MEQKIPSQIEYLSNVKGVLPLHDTGLCKFNELFTRFLENTPLAFFSVDNKWNFVNINKTAEQILQKKKEELIGTSLWQYFTNSEKSSFYNQLNKAKVKKANVQFEAEYKPQNIWLSIRAFPSNRGLLVYFQDITWQKWAEKSLHASEIRFHSIFNHALNGIALVSLNGKLIKANKALCDILGYSKQEILGIRFQDILNPGEVRTAVNNRHIMLQGDIDNYRTTIKYIHKSGKLLHCELSVALIRDNNNNPAYFIHQIQELTRYKTIQAVDKKSTISQNKTEEELLKTENLESLSILAGGIAHDFNNILTVVLGNIALAQMMTSKETETYSQLAEIEKATLQAKNLTQQLLTFSKSGVPMLKTASIKQLIQDTVSFALRGSNVKCNYSLPKDLWPVKIDEGQISQIINNLIINAKQAMPKGGVLKVEAKNINATPNEFTSMPEGKFVLVSIEDEGLGIPQENLAKIFEPYFTTKPTGSGLGLATLYSIIKKHNGHINVESEQGVGTKFNVFLPASEKNISSNKEQDPRLITGKGRILLMDDETTIRYVAGSMLNHFGYDVTEAKDGAEAIKIYREAKQFGKPFDLVIMDLTIPGGMGGKETIGKLLKLDPNVKAVVSSGYSNDPIMTNYEQYGFAEVVEKPYKMVDLSKVVHRVIYGNRR